MQQKLTQQQKNYLQIVDKAQISERPVIVVFVVLLVLTFIVFGS